MREAPLPLEAVRASLDFLSRCEPPRRPLSRRTDAFDGLLGLHRWRWLFLLQGGPSVLVGLLLLLQVRAPS